MQSRPHTRVPRKKEAAPPTPATGGPRSPPCSRRMTLRKAQSPSRSARVRKVQRLPVKRGCTPPPAVLANQMKGKLKDSSSAEDIWDIWPSPFEKLEKQWDNIYIAEFPEITGRQNQGEEEGTDGAPEATVGSPTHLSLGGTGDGDSEGDLIPLPSAQPPVPAASSVPSRSARTPATLPPPPPVPSPTGGPTADGFPELIFGWEMLSLRSLSWGVTSARDLRAAHMAFEQHVADLKWM
ncbi:hypothetical protein ACSSS7_002803 [Eimeria intestinalis]